MLPNRPVNTVNAAVSPGEPPIQPDKSTATEAVTDLGNADFNISSDPPSSATQSALINKPAALPLKPPSIATAASSAEEGHVYIKVPLAQP